MIDSFSQLGFYFVNAHRQRSYSKKKTAVFDEASTRSDN